MPTASAIHTNGRHRDDNGRPVGNSSGKSVKAGTIARIHTQSTSQAANGPAPGGVARGNGPEYSWSLMVLTASASGMICKKPADRLAWPARRDHGAEQPSIV